jgi:hypothetical protein
MAVLPRFEPPLMMMSAQHRVAAAKEFDVGEQLLHILAQAIGHANDSSRLNTDAVSRTCYAGSCL